ncbi:TPA_asm: hypothetical protein GFY42_15260 [Listeria monocytogenes]|nr:hypothetical protein [Listeria monocytogenes]
MDDVMSAIDTGLPPDASLQQSMEAVIRLTEGNAKLRDISLKQITSLDQYLGSVSTHPKAFIESMFKCGAMLVGPQATSYMYPICDIENYPWDFFCPSSTFCDFVDFYKSDPKSVLLEELGVDGHLRVAYFSKYINTIIGSCNVRMFEIKGNPIAKVLELKNTYEQSFISPVCAFCFWPRLHKLTSYRELSCNPGLKGYVRCGITLKTQIVKMKQTRLRKPMEEPLIVSTSSKRAEVVFFENEYGLDRILFQEQGYDMKNMMYAIYNNSTRYLGTVGNML